MKKIPKRIVLYVLMLAGLGLLYSMFLTVLNHAPQLSGIPYALTKAFAGVVTYRAVDDFVLSEVNTYNLMKRNPVGYAIHMLGYAVIIAFSLSTA